MTDLHLADAQHLSALIRARDADHAIELANDSIFGLGGALWTGDVARGKALARRIVSGAVTILVYSV